MTAFEQLFDVVEGVWRFRWLAFWVAAALAVAGWCVVLVLPNKYDAYAQVFVDTRTALRPALQGLTVDQNVDAQINYVRESLLEGPQLEQIARDSGFLSPAITDESERTKKLDQLSKAVVLSAATAGSQGDERSTAGTVYTIRYRGSDRQQSLKIVQTVLDSFVERVLGGKRESSETAQKFLQQQVKDYEARLSAAEERLAAFKKQNIGLMPNDQGGYFAQLQTEVDAAKKAETDLSIAVSRRDELAKQLHSDAAIFSTRPSGGIIGAAGISTGGDTVSRIQEAQAKLDDLLLKFTDKHPDVIAARATLDELKRRRQTELDSLRRGDANALAASGAGDNPVYQSIQLELNKEDVEIAALRRELAQHQGTVAELRQHLNSAPQVEAEYQELNRDYDVNKAEYTALLANYQKAKLGEQADSAGSVRFEVALPPTAPVQAAWPKRVQLLVGVWVAAVAAGVGAAYGVSSLRPVVSSARVIEGFSNFPVLGVVSAAFPTRRTAERRGQILTVAAATACLVLALVAIVMLVHSGFALNISRLTSSVTT
jgi:polysaccharide chain length determinant protein (PEP-CTERM system associated)